MTIEQYREINTSFSRKVVYKIGLSSGFFSEYNNMILAMAYCLTHKIQFVLSSNDANFDPENGWQGFFEPFCEDIVSEKELHYKTVNWKYAIKLFFKKKNFEAFRNFLPYVSIYKHILHTQDVFGRSRDTSLLKRTFHIKQLGANYSFQELCSILVNMTWKYNPIVKKEIEGLIFSLGLPSEYIGFHIRGGDKFLEHPIEAVETYFTKNDTNIKNLFVLTDDYSIISYIREHYPDYTVYTLCEESEHGYFHGDFIKQEPTYKRRKLMRLFASIDILANAKLFVGTFSSNPGMYLGMRVPSIVRGVDFNEWVIW